MVNCATGAGVNDSGTGDPWQQADPWHGGRRPPRDRSANSSWSAGSWHRVGQDHWGRWTPTEAQQQPSATEENARLEAENRRLREELAESRAQQPQVGGAADPAAPAAALAASGQPSSPSGNLQVERLWPLQGDWLRDLNIRDAPNTAQRPMQYPSWTHLPSIRALGIEVPYGPSSEWPPHSGVEIPNLQGPTTMDENPLVQPNGSSASELLYGS